MTLWDYRHLVLAGLWAVLVVPALLWWKESIIFVILLSLYANFEASVAAHHALRRTKDDSSKTETKEDSGGVSSG